ncbi:hypothetical protein HETIRDRAFT_477631, partial [Heterobasidion irregulare TC 32-1]
MPYRAPMHHLQRSVLHHARRASGSVIDRGARAQSARNGATRLAAVGDNACGSMYAHPAPTASGKGGDACWRPRTFMPISRPKISRAELSPAAAPRQPGYYQPNSSARLPNSVGARAHRSSARERRIVSDQTDRLR